MILTKDRNFYKTLFMLAWPIALQNLVTFAVGLADNIMIGALGDTAVSGVYMSGQIQTLLQVFSGGIEGAILILSAQYWGRGDTDSIRKVVTVGLWFSVVFGSALTVVCSLFPASVLSLFTSDPDVIGAGAEYLSVLCLSFLFFCVTQALIAAMRSVESTRIGFYVSLCSLVTNIMLNYLLIFGRFGCPALGIRGAAIATLSARILETAVISVYVFFFDRKLKFRPKHILCVDRGLLGDFIRYGAPVIAGQLVWAANMLTGSAIIGRFDKSVMAAVSVAGTMHNMCYVVMNGMAGAVGIITGKTVGAGNTEKMKEYAVTVQILFLILGVLTSGAILLLRGPFLSLYRISPEALRYAGQFILILSVTVIGTCYQCASLFGLVKSGGDVSFVLKNDAIFVFLVVLPSAYLVMRLGGAPWLVFACLKSDQILKCIVAFFKIRKYDWMKNLTKDKKKPEKT